MHLPHPSETKTLSIPKRTGQYVFGLLALSHLALWELSRSTDDVPFEDLMGHWFLVAAGACAYCAWRYDRRTLPVAASLTIVAYMSRIVCVFAGFLIGDVRIGTSRAWITIIVWGLLTFFMSIVSIGFVKSETHDRVLPERESEGG